MVFTGLLFILDSFLYIYLTGYTGYSLDVMLVGLLWFESLQVMCFQIVGLVRLEGLMLAFVMALQV